MGSRSIDTVIVHGKFPSCSFSILKKERATVKSIFSKNMPQNGSSPPMQSNLNEDNEYNEEDEFPGSMLLKFNQSTDIRAGLNGNKKRIKNRRNKMLTSNTAQSGKMKNEWSSVSVQETRHTSGYGINTGVNSSSTLYTEKMRDKRVRQGSEPYVITRNRCEPTELLSTSQSTGLDSTNMMGNIKQENVERSHQEQSINECSSSPKWESVEKKAEENSLESQSQYCCDEEESTISSNDKKTTSIPFGMPGNQRASRNGKIMNSVPNSIMLKQTCHKQIQNVKDSCANTPTPSIPKESRKSNNGVIVRCLDDDNSKKSAEVTIGNLNSERDLSVSPMLKKEPLDSEELWYMQQYTDLMNNYRTPFIDSHCHLDYIFNKIHSDTPKKKSGIGKYLREWMEQVRVFPRNFQGCIPNFIDPRLFHNIDEKYYDINWLKTQIQEPFVLGATYGIHPKYAHLYDQVKDILESFLKDSAYKAVAIGECGLDTYRNFESFELQKTAFENQLNLACQYTLPIVIHCRSDTSDETYKTERECLRIMQAILTPFHTIHRHCFTMDIQVYDMWIRAFPNTYFGFTPCIENATEKQLDAVRKIPLTRILLETDAPFFRPPLYDSVKQYVPTGPPKTCFPGMAIYTAHLLSKIKRLPLEYVLDITAQNTRRCYRLPEY